MSVESVIGEVKGVVSGKAIYGEYTKLEVITENNLMSFLIQERIIIKKKERCKITYDTNSLSPHGVLQYTFLDEEGKTVHNAFFD